MVRELGSILYLPLCASQTVQPIPGINIGYYFQEAVHNSKISRSFAVNAGVVFGGIASVEVISFTLGGIIFNAVYSSTLQIASGFVFVVMAMFYAVGCILLVCVYIVC
jgi:hypothetical protein